MMTLHQKKLLRDHYDVLFGEEATRMYGKFDEGKVFEATSLAVLDEHYSSKRAGFSSLEEYYHWCSSAYYMHNVSFIILVTNEPCCEKTDFLHMRKQRRRSALR